MLKKIWNKIWNIKDDYYIRALPSLKREAIIASIFRQLAELYDSSALNMTIPVKNFDTNEMKFYFLMLNKIIKNLELNIEVTKNEAKEGERFHNVKLTLVAGK